MTTQQQKEYIAKTVANRIKELVLDKKVQKKMMEMSDDDAKTWVANLAIATLFGKTN